MLGRQPGIEVEVTLLVDVLDAEGRVGHAVSVVGYPWKLALAGLLKVVDVLRSGTRKYKLFYFFVRI